MPSDCQTALPPPHVFQGGGGNAVGNFRRNSSPRNPPPSEFQDAARGMV